LPSSPILQKARSWPPTNPPKSIQDLASDLASDHFSAAEAEAELCRIVGDYRDLEEEQAQAPRARVVREDVEAIATAARALRLAIEKAVGGWRHQEHEPHALELIALGSLVGPSRTIDPSVIKIAARQIRELTPRLDNLERGAEWALHQEWMLPTARGGRARVVNLNPKNWLAMDCFKLFDRARPGKATATRDEPFHQFVEDVFAFATRTSTYSRQSVFQHVKSVIRLARDLRSGRSTAA